MDRIGIGFIGARFTADLHAHALAKLRGIACDIVAVCSVTRQSAEAFARKFNVPHVYTDHRALLERTDIHLVSLPVVTSLHHTLAVDAAKAGKHIIMEKPLTGCFAEAKATILPTDVSLGGVKNLVTAYLSNGVVQVNINPNTSLQVYAPDGQIWGG